MKKKVELFKEVVEICPECGAENHFDWNTDTYIAICQKCGSTMMLCDECIHAEDGLNECCRNCDWHLTEDGKFRCFRCKKEDHNE